MLWKLSGQENRCSWEPLSPPVVISQGPAPSAVLQTPPLPIAAALLGHLPARANPEPALAASAAARERLRGPSADRRSAPRLARKPGSSGSLALPQVRRLPANR